MFYCKPCATKNEWPYPVWQHLSRGPCECCAKVGLCVDVPSSALLEPKRKVKTPASRITG